MKVARSCIVCGARTQGASRCEEHAGAGRRPRGCVSCGVVVASGRDFCGEHEPLVELSRRRRPGQGWRAGYADPAYRRNRAAALRRDLWSCTRCRVRAVEGAVLEVDHVVALSQGGTNDLSNLVTLCRDCHRAKTQGRVR